MENSRKEALPMKSEIEQLAAELAAVRKAGGAKVMYPENLKHRVAALYRRQNGAPLSPFATALGVSATAVSAWLRLDAPQAERMIPVKVAKLKATDVDTAAAASSAIVLSYRGLEIRLPATTSLDQIASLAKAIAEGRVC
jgi:hypothetical protein